MRQNIFSAFISKGFGASAIIEWELSCDIAMANFEAQRVIGLRLAKLAKGGPAAQREARRMAVEKIAASAEMGLAVAGGKSAQSIVRRYRTIMRATHKRLAR